MKVKSKEQEELKKIALGLVNGSIYCDRYIKNPKDVPMVFMPIALGAFNKWTDEECKEIGLVYEYMSEAGGRSIDGMPTFLCFNILNQIDTKIVFDMAQRITKAQEEALNEPKI